MIYIKLIKNGRYVFQIQNHTCNVFENNPVNKLKLIRENDFILLTSCLLVVT